VFTTKPRINKTPMIMGKQCVKSWGICRWMH